jgi:FkbM family methyltransferase
MKRQIVTNRVLSFFERMKFYGILSNILYAMYRLKGKNIRKVSYLRELKVWEFQISNAFYYSTGPGWSYDFDYLLAQFQHNLGFFYQPQNGDVVIDVGAGVGEETIVLSKLVGPTGKVFAIEAHPKTFEALKINTEKNNLSNVILINQAISDSEGHIFIQNINNSLANKITSVKNIDTFKVESITFDSLVDKYKIDKIDFVKVNIEGAEQLLIKGLDKAIPKLSRIAISCHDFRYYNEGDEFFKTKEKVLSFFNQHKYLIRQRETTIALLDDYVYASWPHGKD